MGLFLGSSQASMSDNFNDHHQDSHHDQGGEYQQQTQNDNVNDGIKDDISTQIESTWTEVVDNFDDMSLRENLLRGIFAYGFEKPSAIQQRAIMPAVKGYDLIAQAQSGTGKTATFSVAILQQIDCMESRAVCQALVLAPT